MSKSLLARVVTLPLWPIAWFRRDLRAKRRRARQWLLSINELELNNDRELRHRLTAHQHIITTSSEFMTLKAAIIGCLTLMGAYMVTGGLQEQSSFAFNFSAIVTTFVCAMCMVAVLHFLKSLRATLAIAIFFPLATVGLLSAIGLSRTSISGPAVGSVGGLCILAFGALLVGFEPRLLRRFGAKEQFEARITDRLALAIKLLQPRRWRRPRHRARIAAMLELCAAEIEEVLPRLFKTGDSNNDRWLAQRATEIANALRSLVRSVATPGPTTRDDLLQRLRHDIRVIAFGEWDTLERLPSSSEPTPRRILHAAVAIVRSILLATIPLAGVLVLKHFRPDFQLLPWLEFLAGAWLVVNALFILDPLLPTRITAFRSAAELFRGKGKSED